MQKACQYAERLITASDESDGDRVVMHGAAVAGPARCPVVLRGAALERYRERY